MESTRLFYCSLFVRNGPHELWHPAAALPYIGREVQDVVSMRLEPTTVFPRRTKVLCLYRSFDDVVQSHLVGIRPHFDHPEVVSRIELFGCPDTLAPPPGGVQGCVTFYTEGGCEELMAVFENKGRAGGGGGGGQQKGSGKKAAAAAAAAELRDRSFHYPPETGYLLGSARGAIHTVVLRVHYDSRGLKGRSPVQDTSGITLYTTPILRRYSIGSFFMDLNLYIAIPPHVSQFSVTGTCRAKGMVPLDANLTVFAHYDHTHGLGTGVEVEVTDDSGTPPEGGPDDTPIPPLRVLRSRRSPAPASSSASPSSAPPLPASTGPWMLTPPLSLSPHRKLELKCEYNSLKKSVTTYAASDAERGEMCMFYMWYFPREPRLMTAVRCKKG
eukprot:jgi/Mesvir1/10642/Mv13738-RA.1